MCYFVPSESIGFRIKVLRLDGDTLYLIDDSLFLLWERAGEKHSMFAALNSGPTPALESRHGVYAVGIIYEGVSITDVRCRSWLDRTFVSASTGTCASKAASSGPPFGRGNRVLHLTETDSYVYSTVSFHGFEVDVKYVRDGLLGIRHVFSGLSWRLGQLGNVRVIAQRGCFCHNPSRFRCAPPSIK